MRNIRVMVTGAGGAAGVVTLKSLKKKTSIQWV